MHKFTESEKFIFRTGVTYWKSSFSGTNYNTPRTIEIKLVTDGSCVFHNHTFNGALNNHHEEVQKYIKEIESLGVGHFRLDPMPPMISELLELGLEI